ncbi:MAG: LysM peptidoglycan-binding domain-containing protein [Actinomycetes bacterium]
MGQEAVVGCVQQAVQEFDEEVRAPWRPLLVQGSQATSPVPAVGRRDPARPGSSRVGVCRPSGLPDRRLPAASSRPVRSPGGGQFSAPGASSASPAGARARGRRRTTVRFTRRAHRLAVALALCGGMLAGSLLGQLSPDGGPGLRLAGTNSVVVEQGDTLWSIATSVAVDEDVRVVVDRIQELNGLRGTDVVPGQVLLLP